MQCNCEQGSFDTGWHEQRGAGCLAEELAQWDALNNLSNRDLVLTTRPCARDERPLGCTQQQTKGANVSEQKVVLAGRIGPRWGAQLADGTVEARTPNPGALRAVFEIIDQKGAYNG